MLFPLSTTALLFALLSDTTLAFRGAESSGNFQILKLSMLNLSLVKITIFRNGFSLASLSRVDLDTSLPTRSSAYVGVIVMRTCRVPEVEPDIFPLPLTSLT